MNHTAEQVLDAALALPEDDRLALVEALILSLQSPEDEPPLNEEWREVIERPSSEFDAGAVELISWSEVKRRARHTPGG